MKQTEVSKSKVKHIANNIFGGMVKHKKCKPPSKSQKEDNVNGIKRALQRLKHVESASKINQEICDHDFLKQRRKLKSIDTNPAEEVDDVRESESMQSTASLHSTISPANIHVADCEEDTKSGEDPLRGTDIEDVKDQSHKPDTDCSRTQRSITMAPDTQIKESYEEKGESLSKAQLVALQKGLDLIHKGPSQSNHHQTKEDQKEDARETEDGEEKDAEKPQVTEKMIKIWANAIAAAWGSENITLKKHIWAVHNNVGKFCKREKTIYAKGEYYFNEKKHQDLVKKHCALFPHIKSNKNRKTNRRKDRHHSKRDKQYYGNQNDGRHKDKRRCNKYHNNNDNNGRLYNDNKRYRDNRGYNGDTGYLPYESHGYYGVGGRHRGRYNEW